MEYPNTNIWLSEYRGVDHGGIISRDLIQYLCSLTFDVIKGPLYKTITIKQILNENILFTQCILDNSHKILFHKQIDCIKFHITHKTDGKVLLENYIKDKKRSCSVKNARN